MVDALRTEETQTDELNVAGATHRRVNVGEVHLHCVEAGSKGPLVILLHGFPEFWWSWRHQIPALASAGYRVVAPDLRGYNLSDKPRETSAYALPHLVADVAGLIRALGEKKAHVVGHDWGGAVAWAFAMAEPAMVDKLVALNCPHPTELLRGFRTFRQLRKSWYMFFFQLPGLAERMISSNDYAFLRKSLRTGSTSDADIEHYVDAAKRADRLHGGINYYRASMRALATRSLPEFRTIDARTMVIWGEKDPFLGKELARPSAKWVPHAHVEWIPSATHWVQVDAPERVNALLIDFLRTS